MPFSFRSGLMVDRGWKNLMFNGIDEMASNLLVAFGYGSVPENLVFMGLHDCTIVANFYVRLSVVTNTIDSTLCSRERGCEPRIRTRLGMEIFLQRERSLQGRRDQTWSGTRAWTGWAFGWAGRGGGTTIVVDHGTEEHQSCKYGYSSRRSNS